MPWTGAHGSGPSGTDRELADVFALQDEITVGILAALRLKEFGRGGAICDCAKASFKGEKAS